jgi:tetratricopeptide (TPR) repeat protein
VSRIEELERRVRQDPASIAFGALAEEYRRAGRLEDAVAACRAGLERHPSYLSARVTLGRALQELGLHRDARDEFEYVLSIAPDNLAAIRGLAELHGTTEEPEPEPEPEPRTEPVEPAEPAEPGELDLKALDSTFVSDAQRAAQIERLEIWLARLEQARESAHDHA